MYSEALLYSHDYLTPNSIVFDVGANIGEWTRGIYTLYRPKMYCFEPGSLSFAMLKLQFGENPDFTLLKYGIGAKDRKFNLYKTNAVSGDASEFLSPSHRKYSQDMKHVCGEVCDIINVKKVLKEYHIKHIDLLTINCEGGEYELLEYITKSKLIKDIYCIMIAFHYPDGGVNIEDCYNRRDNIRSKLSLTHECDWMYPSNVDWEQWTRL
jgi:FkbM family methyltransferase